MEYKTILYEKRDGVVVITLNRPDRLNAMSKQCAAELSAAVDEINKDPEVRCMVFTGAKRPDGRPCFSVGGDIKEFRTMGFFEALGPENIFDRAEAIFDWSEPLHESQRIFEKVEASHKPSLAAIDGPCTAGGIELASSCDLRIVSETAEISDMHVKNLGQIGGSGATPRIARLVGAAKAKQMVWTGRVYSGKEALAIGFAQDCYPPDRYLAEAVSLAKTIASMKLEAVRMAKVSINAAMDMDLRQALRFSYLCAFAPNYKVMPPEQIGPASMGKGK